MGEVIDYLINGIGTTDFSNKKHLVNYYCSSTGTELEDILKNE